MSVRATRKKSVLKNPMFWAIAATLAVVGFGYWAANQEVCRVDFWGSQSCSGTKWDAFVSSSPNEVGDTLAGFAGALAFVWLIATVVLQGQELKEQREEFEKMALAQAEQVKLMTAQGDIFRDEQRQREEVRNERILSALFDKFMEMSKIHASENEFYSWLVRANASRLYDGEFHDTPVRRYKGKLSADAYLREMQRAVIEFSNDMEAFAKGRAEHDDVLFQCWKYGDLPVVEFEGLIEVLREILKMSETVSAGQRIRIETLGVSRICDHLERVSSDVEEYVYWEG